MADPNTPPHTHPPHPRSTPAFVHPTNDPSKHTAPLRPQAAHTHEHLRGQTADAQAAPAPPSRQHRPCPAQPHAQYPRPPTTLETSARQAPRRPSPRAPTWPPDAPSTIRTPKRATPALLGRRVHHRCTGPGGRPPSSPLEHPPTPQNPHHTPTPKSSAPTPPTPTVPRPRHSHRPGPPSAHTIRPRSNPPGRYSL